MSSLCMMRLKKIASIEEDPDVKDYHKLRVFIQGEGFGFQYGFMFDKEKDDDLKVETVM